MRALANANCIIDHSSGSIVSGGTFTLTSIPSFKVIAEGLGVFFGEVTASFIGGTISGGDPNTAYGTCAIPAGLVKVDNGSIPAAAEGDTGTLNGFYLISGTPTPFSASVEITDAGQASVLGT